VKTDQFYIWSDMSFFESIAMASQERIHSQTLSWFLSSSCDAASMDEKLRFLSLITGKNLSSKQIIKVTTEEDDIDILVYTDDTIVAFENKIKSTTHSNQLQKYDEILKSKNVQNIERIYLALFYEQINNLSWKVVKHSEVVSFLLKLEYSDTRDNVIFQDYLSFYKRLAWSAVTFLTRPEKFRGVFEGGSVKKHEKSEYEYATEEERFICMNQLETIFQKMFYKNLVQKLGEENFLIEETRGNALLNIYAGEIIKGENVYQLGLQLQRNSIKLIFQDKGYSRSKSSDLPKEIIQYFNRLNFFLNCHKSFNLPRSKCYLSISTSFVWGYEFSDKHIEKIKEYLGILREKTFGEIRDVLR